jgi:hypothetical protein
VEEIWEKRNLLILTRYSLVWVYGV